MTGVTIRVDAGDDTLSPGLGRLIDAGRNLAPAMDNIGSAMVASTLLRFDDGMGPDGQLWPPSERAIAKGGLTLVDKGLLKDTIVHRFGNDFAEWGTNRIYAATHQFGDPARNIPERPYLGFSDDDLDEVGLILGDHLRASLQ